VRCDCLRTNYLSLLTDRFGEHQRVQRGGRLVRASAAEDTNTDGLKVFVGGQPLTSIMYFPHFPFGGTKVVVEVFRGPNMYDYTSQPITLIWSTGCQDDIIVSRIQLKPQYLKPCAKVEFHSTNVTFAITPSSYVFMKGTGVAYLGLHIAFLV
jgi:hypothetical protein